MCFLLVLQKLDLNVWFFFSRSVLNLINRAVLLMMPYLSSCFLLVWFQFNGQTDAFLSFLFLIVALWAYSTWSGRMRWLLTWPTKHSNSYGIILYMTLHASRLCLASWCINDELLLLKRKRDLIALTSTKTEHRWVVLWISKGRACWSVSGMMLNSC